MFERCTNPNHTYHKHYRDVHITERWRAFAAFLEDMGERPAGTTLDRWPDPAGNYEPGNVRWATPKQQRLNRRSQELKSAAV